MPMMSQIKNVKYYSLLLCSYNYNSSMMAESKEYVNIFTVIAVLLY